VSVTGTRQRPRRLPPSAPGRPAIGPPSADRHHPPPSAPHPPPSAPSACLAVRRRLPPACPWPASAPTGRRRYPSPEQADPRGIAAIHS